MGAGSDDESAVWTEAASTATPGVYSAASRRFHRHGEGDEYSTMTPGTTLSAFDKFFGGFDPILDAVPIPGDVASCPSGDDVELGADIDAETQADAEVAEQEGEDEEEEGRDEHQPKAELETSSRATDNIQSHDDDDDDDESRNVQSQSRSYSQGRRIVFKSYNHGTQSARKDYDTDQEDKEQEQKKELGQQNNYGQTGRVSGRKNKNLHEKRLLGLFEISISNKEEMTLNGQGSLTDSDDDDDDKDSIVSNDKSFIFDSTDMAQRGRTRAVNVPSDDTTNATSANSILKKHRMDSGQFKNRWNQKLQHLHQQETPRPEEKKVRYKIQVKVDDDATESREVREEEGLGCPQRSFEVEIEDDDREVESFDVKNDVQTTPSTESKSVSTVPRLSVKPNHFIEKESQLPLPSPVSKSIKKNRRVMSKLLRWTKSLRKFSVKLSPVAESIDEWPSSRVQIEEYSYDESSVASEILISKPKVLVDAEKKESKKMGEIGSTEAAITKLLERRNETREVRLAAAIEKSTLNNIVEEQETDEPTNPTSDHPRLESILSALVDDPNDLGDCLVEDDTSFGVEVRAFDMSAINAVV